MTTTSDDIKRRLLSTVRKHPEGLTIQELASLLGAHRQTITKYILFLEGAKLIHRRRVGSATLHYDARQFKGGQS